MEKEASTLENPPEISTPEARSTSPDNGQGKDIFHGETPEKCTWGTAGCLQGQGCHQDQGLSDQAGEGVRDDKEEPGACIEFKDRMASTCPLQDTA